MLPQERGELHADRWFEAPRSKVDDAIAASEDATRVPRRRVLSRHEARCKLMAADLAIEHLPAGADVR